MVLEIHSEVILKYKNENLGMLFTKSLKKIPTICVFQSKLSIIFSPKTLFSLVALIHI